MKMNACAMIGQLINTVLVETDGHFEVWLERMVRRLFMVNKNGSKNVNNDGLKQVLTLNASRAYNCMRLEILVDNLMRFIKFDDQKVTNNMCKRAALR